MNKTNYVNAVGYTPMNKLTAIIRQCRFYYATLPLLAIISGFLLANNYTLFQLLLTSLSFTFIHCFESSVNNTYDVKSDKLSVIMRNQNPLATGDLTLQEARIINLVTPSLAILTSLFAGYYWTILIFVIIGLVIIYDLKPLRLKDTPFEIFIVPFYTAFPFLFSYLNATSSITFSPLILFTVLFLFLNLVTDLRHIPDFELDLQRGARTFTVTFGVEATRKLELITSLFTLGSLIVAVFLGFLSVLGLPLLVLTTFFKINILVNHYEALKDPHIWRRFSQAMITNIGAMILSILGTIMSIGIFF